MIYLLDVNVLVALLDQDHVCHDIAQKWFQMHGREGWATCPITENGLIRILGHPRYPKGSGTPAAAAELLSGIRRLPGHSFWGDEISLFDAPHVRVQGIATSAQVSDTYLLALAVHRGAKLATFDRRLSPAAVKGGAAALELVA
jgi:hypothetical protein